MHQSKETKSWAFGKDEISESTALSKANEIIDKLYRGYHVIEDVIKLNNFDSIDDYINLAQELKTILDELYERKWVQKYFSILFLKINYSVAITLKVGKNTSYMHWEFALTMTLCKKRSNRLSC